MERLFRRSLFFFWNFILWPATPGLKLPCILLSEIGFSLELTLWVSIQFTLYLIDGKIIQKAFVLLLELYPMARNTWLKDALHFTFWDRMFAWVCFYKSSFFYPVFATPGLKQLLFGVSYSTNPKNLKRYVFGHLFFDMQITRFCH